MLTGKQKSYLRSLANRINATFQVGKDGVNENMVIDILNYLNKHELMKVSVLQNCSQTKDEIAEIFMDADIEVVQIIGKTFNSLVYDNYINYPGQLPGSVSDKETVCQCRSRRFNPGVGQNPWRRK